MDGADRLGKHHDACFLGVIHPKLFRRFNCLGGFCTLLDPDVPDSMLIGLLNRRFCSLFWGHDEGVCKAIRQL